MIPRKNEEIGQYFKACSRHFDYAESKLLKNTINLKY